MTILDQEREARDATVYNGHGWSHVYIAGKRFTVACDYDRYWLRYGYVADGIICSTQQEYSWRMRQWRLLCGHEKG